MTKTGIKKILLPQTGHRHRKISMTMAGLVLTLLWPNVLLIAGLLLAALTTLAQPDINYVRPGIPADRRTKAIYIEAFGSSGFGVSLNYDTRFRRGHDGWGFRVGVASPIRQGRVATYSVPVLLNRVLPLSGNRISVEVGAGFIATYRRLTYEDQNFIVRHQASISYPAVANLGLRIQPLRTGIVWRIYWAPTWRIGSSFQSTDLHLIGTSLGIAFR